MKMPRFYCSIGRARLLHSINLNLNTSTIIFKKCDKQTNKKETDFCIRYFQKVLIKIPRFFEPRLCIFTPLWLYVASPS